MNQKIKYGSNIFDELSIILQNLNPKNILLVTGKNSFIKSGAKNEILPILKKYNFITFYNQTSYNNIDNIIDGVKLIQANKINLIIAVGGGAVLDKSKIINNLSSEKIEDLEEFIITGKYNKSTIPMIAIPTTAGTGSESTKFATLYINKVKYSIEDDSLIPEFSLINSDFITSNSLYTMLTSGLDALCQSIESYWSVNSNLKSKKYAFEAMSKIWNILPKIANKNWNQKDIDNLCFAANLSGKAINISKTTACHAISYYLTSNYDISHGHAVMLTLGNVFKFNLDTSIDNLNDKRGLKYCTNNLDEICKNLKIDKNNVDSVFLKYLNDLGLKTKLSQFKILKSDLVIIANNINVKRIKNNPRLLTKEDILSILEFIY